MRCAGCGKNVNYHRNIFPVEAHVFCSLSCLKRKICQQSPIGKARLEALGTIAPQSIYGFKDCKSAYLGVNFRSWFECDVAEYIVQYWQTQVFYEPHVLPLDDRHSYLPDFWLPEYGVWLEVKGEWRGGGKNKFIKALHLLGEDRLYLIPDPYRKWFKKGGRI